MEKPGEKIEFLAEERALEDYFTEKGLRNSIGLTENLWNYAIFKELLDNCLDSIESFDKKEIHIEASTKGLFISDNGKGLSYEELSQIYNFYGYFSSKRWSRKINRGSLGNALKTIIGICALKQYPLEWRLKNGTAYKCILNEVQKNRGNLFFETTKRAYNGPWGIFVEGFQSDFDPLEKLLGYHWANPDVDFTLDQQTFYSFSKPLKRRNREFVHWYDFEAFHLRAARICRLNPKKTTRAFLREFSGAQRILSWLPIAQDRLADYVDSREHFQVLYQELTKQIITPNLAILKTFIAPKKSYLEAVDILHYKEKLGSFRHKGAEIPYLLQGFILKNEEQNKVLTTINGSVSYDDFPFHFTKEDLCFMGFEDKSAIKKNYIYQGYRSIKEALQHLHFFDGEGHTLFLNFISPFVEFSDNAKTHINATGFKKELEHLVEVLTSPLLKAIRREELGAYWGIPYNEKGHKKALMERHFLDAFEIASGGYSVFVRQVFYKLHEILNHEYGVELNNSDYKNLTQNIATMMLQKYQEVAQRLLFSIRGYFHHSFYGLDLPLGTKEIRKYANTQRQNRILIEKSVKFDFEDRYLLKNILFIEKVGFNIVLEESGITKELNLSIMSTQGTNTRAGAMFLQYCKDQNLNLFSLTDFDFAGLKIHESIVKDSPTYRAVPGVERIGLSLDEIKLLQLVPETISYRKDYRASALFSHLDPQDQDFFTKADTLPRKKFQRVELNALSNQQLIALLREKINENKIIPPDEMILNAFEVDEIELKKSALWNKFGYLFDGINVTIDKKEVLAEVKNSAHHWLETLPRAKVEYEKEMILRLTRKLDS